jgi:DNA topoisomerase II
VEPKYYIPVIPTLLINGTKGIGTGWSTSVPPYNALKIAEHLSMRIR